MAKAASKLIADVAAYGAATLLIFLLLRFLMKKMAPKTKSQVR